MHHNLKPLPPLSGDFSIRTRATRPQPTASGIRRLAHAFVLCTLLSLVLLWVFEAPLLSIIGTILRTTGLAYIPTAMDIINELYSAIAYLVAFLLPYLLYARLIRLPLRCIPRRAVHPPILLASSGISMGASLLGLFISMIVMFSLGIFGLTPPDIPLHFPTHPVAMVLMIINMTIIPAVIEELIYRGIVMHSLRAYGNGTAIVISALFFALMHRNMSQLPHALVLGLIIGYLVIQTGSLYTGIFIHMVNNLLVVLLVLASERTSELGAMLLSLGQLLLYICASIAALLYFGAVRHVVWRLPSVPDAPPMRQMLGAFLKSPPILLLLVVFAFQIAASYYS